VQARWATRDEPHLIDHIATRSSNVVEACLITVCRFGMDHNVCALPDLHSVSERLHRIFGFEPYFNRADWVQKEVFQAVALLRGY